MNKVMDAFFERADYLIQESEQIPLPEPRKPAPSTKWKSLRKKVRDSYHKQLTNSSNEFLRNTSNFFDGIISNYDCPKILINLFPAGDGYSVTLMKKDGVSAESLHMPYEESELLDYIDNEELPPIISDCLHKHHQSVFISGSVVAEIRDYRIAADQNSYETHFVLLRPTQQTLTNDVNIIARETSGSFKWGLDDKLVLESLLTLATAEPLCLDTSPTVAIVKNKMHVRKGRFNTPQMRKMIRRKGMLAHKRERACQSQPAPSALKLHDFLLERKRLKKEHMRTLSPDVKLPIDAIDIWRKEPLSLSFPTEIDATKYLPAPSEHIDSEDIVEVQSILLESEGGNRDVVSRITIGQRPRDLHYFGMLQSNKYFKVSKNDVEYTNQIFSLGSEYRANLYVLQYHELFTEDGRRPVKVTVRHVNKSPTVSHVPNQQQPWQLSQEKSVYTVGSITDIPRNKWTRMTPSSHAEFKAKAQQQQQRALLQKKQMQQKVQIVTKPNQLPATTPTLNTITLQNSSQNVFNFQNSGQRVTKTKSLPGTEPLAMQTPQIQLTGQLQNTNESHHELQQRQKLAFSQSVQEPTRVVLSKTNSNTGGSQTITMNSSALATALGQIGGTVNVQVPVMTVNAQRTVNDSQIRQSQGHATTAVIRMPIGIASNANSSGQITTLNLISGGQTVLGNILPSGGGNITIPANQLPANIAMQLTGISNNTVQPQISLVSPPTATSTSIQPQQISLVNQSGNSTPFTIIANNEGWQTQDRATPTPQQQTLTIAPRTQIAPSSSRPNQVQQNQPVHLLQQVRIPAHLLNLNGANLNETIQQFIASQSAAKNVKKRN